MEKIIDLRSDTVTHPTLAMREAMFNAKIGDDIMREDPTVIELEELVANMLGKESGVFVSSGTMANQLAVMAFTNRGEEIILANNSHMFNLEVGGLAALSQVQTRTFPMKNGLYDIEYISGLIQEEGIQRAKTGLICIENTNDLNAGLVVPKENIDKVCKLGKDNNIPVYMDGARLFNAAVELGIDAKDIVENVDAVMVALTKGLAAPFGAVLVGTNKFIEKARWFKQRIGGGYRQAGFMAAPAIVALQTMMPQLSIDHKNAKLLGELLTNVDNLTVNKENIHTNILTGKINDELFTIEEFLDLLNQSHIKAKRISNNSFRMVLHYGIEEDDVNYVANTVKKILDKNEQYILGGKNEKNRFNS